MIWNHHPRIPIRQTRNKNIFDFSVARLKFSSNFKNSNLILNLLTCMWPLQKILTWNFNYIAFWNLYSISHSIESGSSSEAILSLTSALRVSNLIKVVVSHCVVVYSLILSRLFRDEGDNTSNWQSAEKLVWRSGVTLNCFYFLIFITI